MQVVPLTIAHLVQDKLDSLFANVHTYLAPDDERLAGIERDLERLASKRADQSSILRVRYAVLLGDQPMAEYWLANAEKLRAPRNDLEFARLVISVNFGYFTLANAPLRYLSDPTNGVASTILSLRSPTGSYHLYDAMYTKASEMNILDFPARPAYLPDVIAAMDYWGDSDDDYAAALDVVGTVLRQHRLQMMKDGFGVEVSHPRDGGPPTVRLSLELNLDLESCLDLTSEYTDKLAHSSVKIPPSMTFEFLPEIKNEH